VEEVKEACIGAYGHQEIPFEKVVEEIGPARDLSHSPLFQVVFELQDASIENLQGPGLTISRFNVNNDTAKFDLDLLMIDEGDRFVASFEYNTDLFDQTTIKRMAGHFVRLLESIVADPSLTIENLSILTEAEREIITQWNRTETDYPLNVCLHELFEQQVARTPDAMAVSFEGECLTYQQLNARANRMARGLIERGIGPETLVALLANRSIEMLVAILGIFKAGGAYVPLDPKHPPSRLAAMLAQSKSEYILATSECLSVAQEALQLEPREQAPAVLVYERLLEKSHAETNIGKRSDPSNLAYVIFTSGSTGRPKGAMIEQAGMVNHILSKIDDLRITSGDVLAQNASQCFDVSVWQFLATLLVGGRTEILNDEDASDPLQLLRAIERTGITILEIVPSQLRSLLEQISFSVGARPDLSTLRWIFVMGEVLPPELCRQWQEIYPGAVMINAYGVTEVSDDVSHHHLYRPPADTVVRVPVGGPLPNMRLYVLDKTFSIVPIGIPGELYIGGICVGRGYLDDPERTASVFVPDPFSARAGARLYKTGDLVRFLPDGNLDFLGRADYQVKVRGFRVELGEIEAALDRHPAIWQSVVVAREDVPGEKRLLAYIVSKSDQLLTIGDLRAYLKEMLPDYMIPSAFITLDSLPLNSNGKVDRHALPLPESARPDLEKEYVAPTSPAEKRLATIWEQVLRVDAVGIHDNFFELGGDSIMMIQVISRAGQAGLRLTLKQAFQYQTIAELAAHAASAPDVKADQGIVTGRVPLTPAQSWLVEQDLQHPHHFNQAVMFEVEQPVDSALMTSVVRHILIQHDALRLRFGGQTRWEPFIGGVDETTPFTLLDLSGAARQEQSILIEAAASQLQASLNLTEGPLMRVALFDLGAGLAARLLIVIHHMAIDGVSWRILVEDLQTAYRQLSRGEQVKLPAKTTSFKEWAERLSEYSRSEDLRQEASYWASKSRRQARGLPKDFSDGENTVATIRTFTTSLTAAETQTILRTIPTTFNTQINDVLLTALAQAFEQWTSRRRLLIDLEGHGREDIFDDMDLSRTVGWFTSIYPVLLEPGEASSPVESLKAIKERLRSIPNRGIGYGVLRYLSRDADTVAGLCAQPRAEVIFNYLGQFNNNPSDDEQATHALYLGPAPEDSGPPRSPLQKRRYLFEVSAMVAGEQLHIIWKYSESIHRRSTIERLAGGFVEALRLLIEQSTEAARFVSTDFPEIELNQEKVEKALAELDLG
jgi:amino acid adenylation domain-containing protein/non-ribosomal peptide synthase protein (TIGR01720 family)